YSHLSLFFDDPAPSQTYTLSLHDALPISLLHHHAMVAGELCPIQARLVVVVHVLELRKVPRDLRVRCAERLQVQRGAKVPAGIRSEEHTSELQSLAYLVCRLLLEKKKKTT